MKNKIFKTQNQPFCTTSTGAKYHLPGCRYLHSSSNSIDVGSARSTYSPCKVCNPSASFKNNSINSTITENKIMKEKFVEYSLNNSYQNTANNSNSTYMEDKVKDFTNYGRCIINFFNNFKIIHKLIRMISIR